MYTIFHKVGLLYPSLHQSSTQSQKFHLIFIFILNNQVKVHKFCFSFLTSCCWLIDNINHDIPYLIVGSVIHPFFVNWLCARISNWRVDPLLAIQWISSKTCHPFNARASACFPAVEHCEHMSRGCLPKCQAHCSVVNLPRLICSIKKVFIFWNVNNNNYGCTHNILGM